MKVVPLNAPPLVLFPTPPAIVAPAVHVLAVEQAIKLHIPTPIERATQTKKHV